MIETSVVSTLLQNITPLFIAISSVLNISAILKIHD